MKLRFRQTAAASTLCICLSILWHAYRSPLDGLVPVSYTSAQLLGANAVVSHESNTGEASHPTIEHAAPQVKTGRALEDYRAEHLPHDVVESKYECTGQRRQLNMICYFENVFLWQGKVVFVSNNGSLELPRIPIDFRVISGLAFLTPVVLSPHAVAEVVQSAKTIVDWSGPQDEVHVWSGAVRNYGHFMGEDMPSLHNTLCKYLGRCGGANTSGLHLVLARENMYSWSPYVDTAMACLSESRLVNMYAPERHDTLFVVRRLMMGVGPDCRAAVFCRSYRKRPIAPKQYRLYRSTMATCLGFSASAVAPLFPRPKLLVVDRLYSSGRHFLNIQEMMEGLRGRYGGFADIELRYMENATLLEQVRLWNSASVAIHMHGASLGNWAFLPHKSVGVHITMETIGNPFPKHFVKDLAGVTDVSAVLVNVTFHPNVVLRIRQFEQMHEWREELTPQDKLNILERGDCKNISKPDIPGQLSCDMKYLLKGHDLALPLGQLYTAVDEAVWLLYHKQGQNPPEWLLESSPPAVAALQS